MRLKAHQSYMAEMPDGEIRKVTFKAFKGKGRCLVYDPAKAEFVTIARFRINERHQINQQQELFA